jgi:hypothetical protein
MMPDRTNARIGFLNNEDRLAFTSLNTGFPQFFIGPAVNVAAQDLGAFVELGPIVPLRAGSSVESNK